MRASNRRSRRISSPGKKILCLEKRSLPAAEIAQRLRSDRPTISGIINRLEKKGIVLKLDNPEDKRSSYLQIDKGFNQLVDSITRMSDELTVDIFSIYSEEEAKQLMHLVQQLIERTEDCTTSALLTKNASHIFLLNQRII